MAEPDYDCSNNTCYYIGQITLNILSIDKNSSSNELMIQLDIGPSGLAFWNTVNFSAMVILSNTTFFSSYDVLRNPDGTVTIIANYNTSIDNINITVELNPALSGERSLSRLSPIYKDFIFVPADNNPNQDVELIEACDLCETIRILSMVVAGLFWLLFVIGVFSGKLIGVESMAVIQISCLSLMSLS